MPDVPSASSSGPVVALDGVTVRYGAREALSGVTVACPAGAVGLLGPNGAGKSSFLKVLLGLVAPAAGNVRVLGVDAAAAPLAVRARLGYMPEHDAHGPGMTAVGFVAYCGQLCGLPRNDATQRAHEVLGYVGLGEARYRLVETYATGMKQRLKLAQALVHDPDLLLLDEPTNGLDPEGRDDMLGLIDDLAHARGVSVLLSSHLLPDVEQTCDRVIVMDQGRVAADGAISALRGPAGAVVELRLKGDRRAFLDALAARGASCPDPFAEPCRVFLPEGLVASDLFRFAAAHGVQVRHLRRSVPTLDDVFARVVGPA